jgi:hypothetical protein
MIKTSKGLIPLNEALTLFKQAKLPDGELRGIYRQLDGYPEGKEAAGHVLSNPTRYSEKLQRMATEKTTGRPIGAKVINDIDDLHPILQKCGLRARVAITIKKERTRGILLILGMLNLEISQDDRMLLRCVLLSGEWAHVSRTFIATLSLAAFEGLSEAEVFSYTKRDLFDVVEKIELLSTLEERIRAIRQPRPMSEATRAILATNPDLFFDRNLFTQVCDERAFGKAEEIAALADNVSIEEALMAVFLGDTSRQEFLEFYIEAFNTALA